MDAALDKRMTLYGNLMEEAKVRIELISQILQGRGEFHQVVQREFCFLQLRMLCELVALSCLVAHGDISSLQAHKVGKAYSADEIMKKLEELRPDFYPKSINSKKTGEKFHEITALDPQPFPKADLLSLYGTTHRYVHRGSLRGLLATDVPIDTNFNAEGVHRWAQLFVNMLQMHLISISTDRQMICVLRGADNGQKVTVAIADAVKPLSPSKP